MSHITLPAAHVVALATRAIEGIDMDLRALTDARARALLARTEKGWWGRFQRRWLGAPSDMVSARKAVERSHAGLGELWHPALATRVWLQTRRERCVKILNLARLAAVQGGGPETPVRLAASDSLAITGSDRPLPDTPFPGCRECEENKDAAADMRDALHAIYARLREGGSDAPIMTLIEDTLARDEVGRQRAHSLLQTRRELRNTQRDLAVARKERDELKAHLDRLTVLPCVECNGEGEVWVCESCGEKHCADDAHPDPDDDPDMVQVDCEACGTLGAVIGVR